MGQGNGCEGVRAAGSMLARSIDVQAYSRCRGKRAESEVEGELRIAKARSAEVEVGRKGKDRG